MTQQKIDRLVFVAGHCSHKAQLRILRYRWSHIPQINKAIQKRMEELSC